MKITSEFTVECCSMKKTFSLEYEAWSALFLHIKIYHKQIFLQLTKRARQLARSQNGRGYYDGSDKDTGWPKASASFRQAWTVHALKEKVLLERI